MAGYRPMKSVAGVVEDHSSESNMCAYLAVGVWHPWVVRRDGAFVRRLWPTVRRALDYVVSMQLSFGGIAWSQEWNDGAPAKVNEEALLAGSSSIYQAIRSRSEERRVGKECVSTCRSRGSPAHENKNIENKGQ